MLSGLVLLKYNPSLLLRLWVCFGLLLLKTLNLLGVHLDGLGANVLLLGDGLQLIRNFLLILDHLLSSLSGRIFVVLCFGKFKPWVEINLDLNAWLQSLLNHRLLLLSLG